MLTLGRARVSFAANCARLLINLSLGLAMVYWLGGRGIGYGLLLGNAVALAWLWNALAAETQHGGRSTAPYGQWRGG